MKGVGGVPVVSGIMTVSIGELAPLFTLPGIEPSGGVDGDAVKWVRRDVSLADQLAAVDRGADLAGSVVRHRDVDPLRL